MCGNGIRFERFVSQSLKENPFRIFSWFYTTLDEYATFSWWPLPWSECDQLSNGRCGRGHRQREVRCMKNDIEHVDAERSVSCLLSKSILWLNRPIPRYDLALFWFIVPKEESFSFQCSPVHRTVCVHFYWLNRIRFPRPFVLINQWYYDRRNLRLASISHEP